jgi:HSP20 family protein
MNEDQENKDIIEEVESEEEIYENEKKQNEIIVKRNEVCHFKTDHPETLEIREDEAYFRTPMTNIIESEDLYYVLVELPGLDKKHVKISLQEGILEISGEKKIKDKEKRDEKKEKDKKEKKEEKKDKDKKKEKYKEIKGDFLRREIRTTNFFRCFHLPDDINTEEIDASFKNGILRLKIPKKTAIESEKRVIEIK